jgi:phenylalanyl-tRNA synthetase beta chain
VDENLEKHLNPELVPFALINPISSELSVMRTSLWQGLLSALAFNQRHQQQRIRLFETGLRFVPTAKELIQENVIAGAIIGPLQPESFHGVDRVDFYDLKGDVEALLEQTLDAKQFSFVPDTHPALHPGQTASIQKDGKIIGWIGTVHPTVVNAFSIKGSPVVFEIELAALESRTIPAIQPWSKFPHSARDLAVVVDEATTSSKLLEVVNQSASKFLANARIFDIYRGKGVDLGRKSVALDLIFSDSCRTLNDEEVKSEMEAILSGLNSQLGATLRE